MANKYLVFDIETHPRDDITDYLKIQKTVHGNPLSNDKEQRSKEITYVQSINAPFSTTRAIGCLSLNGEKRTEHYFGYPMKEDEILSKFWNLANEHSVFITFNGDGFDVKYLEIRSLINHITPSIRIETYPYRDIYGYPKQNYAKHIDLQAVFGGPRSNISLHNILVSENLNGKSDNPEALIDIYRDGQIEEYTKRLEEYCMNDVRGTADLFMKYRDMLLPMMWLDDAHKIYMKGGLYYSTVGKGKDKPNDIENFSWIAKSSNFDLQTRDTATEIIRELTTQ